MNFNLVFKRQVGGASSDPALGSDATPSAITDLTKVCVLKSQLANMNGWPMQRIVVGYSTSVAGLALPCTIFVWEEKSASWYICQTKTLVLNGLVWFDMPIPNDPPQSGGNQNAKAGALEAYIKVSTAGGDPAGVYPIVAAADLSNTTRGSDG